MCGTIARLTRYWRDQIDLDHATAGSIPVVVPLDPPALTKVRSAVALGRRAHRVSHRRWYAATAVNATLPRAPSARLAQARAGDIPASAEAPESMRVATRYLLIGDAVVQVACGSCQPPMSRLRLGRVGGSDNGRAAVAVNPARGEGITREQHLCA
jgi:hypothetical protein